MGTKNIESACSARACHTSLVISTTGEVAMADSTCSTAAPLNCATKQRMCSSRNTDRRKELRLLHVETKKNHIKALEADNPAKTVRAKGCPAEVAHCVQKVLSAQGGLNAKDATLRVPRNVINSFLYLGTLRQSFDPNRAPQPHTVWYYCSRATKRDRVELNRVYPQVSTRLGRFSFADATCSDWRGQPNSRRTH